MKFGMNLLLWTGDLNEGLLPVLESLKQMGYDGVEIPMFDFDTKKYAEWGKRLDGLGLARTVVTCRGADDNPIAADAKVRATGVANTCRTLDCCQALGATILAGPYHSAIGHFSGCGPTRDEWRWGVEGMRKVAEHAAKTGVTLAVEYLNRFETYLLNTAVDTARFVREVEHPNCRMMYDTFHANIEERNIADAIRACREYTVHVHISENDRSIPGTGHVDWKTSFDTLKETGYQGWMTIEAFGLALPEIAAATKIWRRLFADELALAREGLAFMKRQCAERGIK
ncbi:MAG TPA: sugar phosphate isomerase/epimerase [Pirellulales bacterium]|nr:sugar phosphate isomerase/epimerase [Pirellulales bacterium]